MVDGMAERAHCLSFGLDDFAGQVAWRRRGPSAYRRQLRLRDPSRRWYSHRRGIAVNPAPASAMDVSIVILNYNDKEYLRGCLQSLAHCSRSRQVEIIVSDNASTDGSIEMVESEFPRVRLLKNKENLGFTKGNNVGIRASAGRYVFLLNSDIKVLDGCIDAMAEFLDDHPDVGLAGPKVLNRDLSHQSTCRRYPTLWNNFCEVTGLSKLFRGSRVFCGEHMFFFHGDREMDVHVLVGCFSALRRRAIDQAGMLDEEFLHVRRRPGLVPAVQAGRLARDLLSRRAGDPLHGDQHDEKRPHPLRLAATTVGPALLAEISQPRRGGRHPGVDPPAPDQPVGDRLLEMARHPFQA